MLLLVIHFLEQVPRWQPEDFLANLSAADLDPVLTVRLVGNPATAAVALYGAFITSPNFAHWFKQRRKSVLHLVEPEPEAAPAASSEVRRAELS
jgi:hypothetical protein